MIREFQIVVVGGGHAGVEAAWAAANMVREPGAIALVTLDPAKIGVMSCNPAIGGLAKGQLVREVDAMGGLMGLATDASGIQFRVLNKSKGEAVHGPRAQCDKHAYADVVRSLIASRREIEIIRGGVERIIVEGGVCRGVEIATDAGEVVVRARAVVLTTGTFMRGLMHTGPSRTPGGRFGEAAATGISGALRGLGFELGRLKTGTPPRLKRSTIRWEELEPQHGDAPPVAFSDLTPAASDGPRPEGVRVQELLENHGVAVEFPFIRQIECRQTRTTAEAHALIRENLHRAPMYSGQIESAGPRYCPSIEDKVVRFAERDAHGVFLEPESHRDDWVYCNGISTSLPADVQDAIVRSMPGCERAEIYRYGYAVEYDMVRPHQIGASGQTKLVGGLLLAGQINGTSGYEEAAAQGLIAGINAVRVARGEPEFTLGRDQAYIGVLMDDLVTRTPVEPYRMFTSRAEHRLLLRSDNAADRLTAIARDLGLLGGPLGARRRTAMEERSRGLAQIARAAAETRLGGEPLLKAMRKPEFGVDDLRAALAGITARPSVWETALADRKYEPFIARQRAEIRRHQELEHRRLPSDVDYHRFDALRAETRQALARFRPETFGQASRLEGVTPADMMLLSVLLHKRGR